MKKRTNNSSGGWVLRITFCAVLASASAILLALSFNLKAVAAPSFATLFLVTTTADHNDFSCDNDCTLREAIQAANNTGGDSVINFSIPTTDPGYSNGVWTITLAAALPPLNTSSGSSNLSINGPGADKLTVQRNPNYGPPVSAPLLQFRIFNVTTSGMASISGMTITNGSVFSQTDYLGGGIQNYNAGTVSLTNCVLKNNQAGRWTDFRGNFGPYALGGGIANRAGGTVNITSSTLDNNQGDYGGGIYNSGNGTINVSNSNIGGGFGFGNSAAVGGGIYNDGIINVTGTTFGNNSADSGGGIYNNGTLTITGSTFDSNQCTEDGGGIYNTDTAAVSVSNSTFYFNFTSGIDSSRSASGGAVFNANALSVFDSTFTLNHVGGYGSRIGGGGIFNESGATAAIKSSIFSDNYIEVGAQSVVGGNDLYGSFTSRGFNLIGSTDGNTGFTARTDLTSADPKFELDSSNLPNLKDNGGPTDTIALVCG